VFALGAAKVGALQMLFLRVDSTTPMSESKATYALTVNGESVVGATLVHTESFRVGPRGALIAIQNAGTGPCLVRFVVEEAPSFVRHHPNVRDAVERGLSPARSSARAHLHHR